MATTKTGTDDLVQQLDKLVDAACSRYPQEVFAARREILQAHAATVRMNLEQLDEAHANAVAHRAYVKEQAATAALEAAGLDPDPLPDPEPSAVDPDGTNPEG